jgi:hypothetical protein
MEVLQSSKDFLEGHKSLQRGYSVSRMLLHREAGVRQATTRWQVQVSNFLQIRIPSLDRFELLWKAGMLLL